MAHSTLSPRWPGALGRYFGLGLMALSLPTPATPQTSREVRYEISCREARGSNPKLARCFEPLGDLKDPDLLEGPFFRVVQGTSDLPIRLSDANPELRLRAVTVYVHLERARRYALERPELRTLASTLRGPVVVRIDQTRGFSDTTHFTGESQPPQFNNALTVPASGRLRSASVPAWGNEIWFFRAQDERSQSTASLVGAYLSARETRSLLLGQFTYQEAISVGQTLALRNLDGEPMDWVPHLASLASALAITELILPLFGPGTRWARATHRIDTALLPEVIYHEFGHLLFERHLGLFRPTAIVEGYPNYFASRVAGIRNLGDRAKGVIRGFGAKRGDSKVLYSDSEERTYAAATGSFVFSLLDQVREVLSPEDADAVVYGALSYLNRSSRIRGDLERALFQSIREKSKTPERDLVRALRIYESRGL